MRTLWIAAAALVLAAGALVLVLRGGDEEAPAGPAKPPAQVPATAGAPAAPRPSPPRPVIAADRAGDAAPRRPRPGLEATGAELPDGGAPSIDDELRAWARRKRAENAERLVEARAEIRARVTERVTAEVDGAIDRLTRELAAARSAGDRGRVQALESRLAGLRDSRDTLIEERIDAIVAE